MGLWWNSSSRASKSAGTSPDSLLLEFVPGRGRSERVREAIAGRFGAFLESVVRFRVVCVKEVEKTSTGKRNPIINRMRRTSHADYEARPAVQ